VRNLVVTASRAAVHRIMRNAPMCYVELSRIGDDYRGRFSEFDAALHTVACPTLLLLGSRTERGPTGPAFQVVRDEAARRAIELNPRIRVQWIDGRHNMIRTHPREIATAVALLHADAK
jgi:pimeloyl-ACP methyl ester carboxylesterase